MGIVYLIYDYYNECYKIGVTKNIKQRMRQLQCGNPSKLELIATHNSEFPYKVESLIHSSHRSNNVLNEWYYLDDSIRDTFLDECAQAETVIEALKDNPFFFKQR